MKNRTKFILVVLALLVIFVLIEYRMPRKFSWVPTFSHTDDQPFGCELLDSTLSASMPLGYTVERRTLWQLEKDSLFTTPKGIVIVSTDETQSIIPQVQRLAQRGSVVLVAASMLYGWKDSLSFQTHWKNSFRITDIVGKFPEKGVIRWNDNSQLQWKVYPQLVEQTIEPVNDSIACTVLALYSDEEPNDTLKKAPGPVAISFPQGKGEIIIVSAPLLFTNYMLLSDNGSSFIGRVMNRMKHLPVIRTESYMEVTAQAEQSPLYVFLYEPPLRWAVYLTMLTLLLFCFFTARRRQRVIPIINRPANGNLEFVRLIGTLFWQQHDNSALLAKKLAYTADTLRRDMGIDISEITTSSTSVEEGPEPARDQAPLLQLSAHTGRPVEELRLLLHNIRQASSGYYTVSDAELKTFIDELDSLINSA